MVIYEPSAREKEIDGILVTNKIEELNDCDIILANRMEKELEKFKDKVYTRDIYSKDE
jgi:UDPglucose 6-dehydrogenase